METRDESQELTALLLSDQVLAALTNDRHDTDTDVAGNLNVNGDMAHVVKHVAFKDKALSVAGSYYFFPSKRIYGSYEPSLHEMEERVVERVSSNRLKCLVLDYKWLEWGRDPIHWLRMFAGIPCLTEVRFYQGRDDMNFQRRRAVWAPRKDDIEAASRLAVAVVKNWQEALDLAKAYFDDHDKWGIVISSRRPPGITVWQAR